MNNDENLFGCLGIPTPLEMCKQHAVLLEGENEDLTQQLQAARKNIAKLVEINAQVSAERDKLGKELIKVKTQNSDLNHENSEQGRTINSLLIVREQRDFLLREKNERDLKAFNEQKGLTIQNRGEQSTSAKL